MAQRASITLFVRNDGAASVALSTSIASSDFTIDAAGSTCGGGGMLETGGYCHVHLVFAPSMTGALDAALHLALDGGGATDVALHGMGVMPVAGLTTDASALDFGVIVADGFTMSPTASVLVSNGSASDVTIGAPAVTGPGFHLVGHDCPTTLTPGGACTVMLDFSPVAAGPAAGSLTISSATSVQIPLTGFGARVFKFSTRGGGTGTITSAPDVTCGAACIDNALGTVVLTATPGTGSVFAGWQGPCGIATTCTIPPGPSVYLTADFELSGGKALMVTFAGTGSGAVNIYTGTDPGLLTTCFTNCTTYVPSGTHVEVFGFTPSTFVGWSGACSGTSQQCNLGTVINDRAMTVTFNRDDREVATLSPLAPPTAIAYAPDGNLVVADAAAIRKLTPTGSVVWTATGVGGADAIATDSAGDVFGLAGATLFKLTPAGALAWPAPVPVPGGVAHPYQSFASPLAISHDGTVIAVLQDKGAYVADGSGAQRFHITNLTEGRAIAVAADGTVAIADDNGSGDNSNLRRFTKTGTALATIPSTGEAGYYDIAIAFDASGDVYGYSTGFSSAIAARLAPSGAAVFEKPEDTLGSADLPTGAVVASTGDLIAARGLGDGSIPGLQLEQWSATGTLLWPHTKPYHSNPLPFPDDGVIPTAIAADGAKHFAVGGTYGLDQPWIQIYVLP
jgi:hypothetical protein